MTKRIVRKVRRAIQQASPAVVYTTLAAVSLWAQTMPPAGVPAVIYEHESSFNGTWTWDNGHFDAYWPEGDGPALATITVQSFTSQSVVLMRTDTPQSVSAGLTAVYTGQISAAGNSIVNGKVTWTWPGHSGYPNSSGWTATWGAPEFTISTVAGSGAAGFSGDGGAATSAKINDPRGVAVDGAGNLYIADLANNRVRKVSPAGVITTFAGTGVQGFAGDGGPATSAELNGPFRVAVDGSGAVYIADSGNNRVRKVSAAGVISTVAGNGAAGDSGDGGPATSAAVGNPDGVAVDSSGNLFISVDGVSSYIRKVNGNGIITTVAGNGVFASSGDGGPATEASIDNPNGVTVDSAGNLYISDQYGYRIRKVSNGIITTVAGNGNAGYSGDGGPATSAEINSPVGTAVDTAGNLYIADAGNNRIRVVLTNGTIWTVAGNGTAGFSGDGGIATNAALNGPKTLAFGPGGVIYFADDGNERIRLLTPVSQTATSGGSAPQIQSVTFTGTAINPTITITGSGFNPAPVATNLAVTGYTGYDYGTSLHFNDNSATHFSAGYYDPAEGRDDLIGLVILQYSDSSITYQLGSSYASYYYPGGMYQLNQGDPFTAYVGTASYSGTVDFGGVPLMPSVGGVVSASAFGGFSAAAPGSFIEIYGANLASDARAWGGSDFVDGAAPTSLDGTKVSIGGQAAFVNYISPGQVNALVPSGVGTGAQQVTVTNAGGTSANYSITVNATEPGLLAPASFKLGGTQYAVAFFADGTYVLPSGAISGITSRPANPGDTIVLYGVGFGPVTPNLPAGQLVNEANTLSSNFGISIGGTPAQVQYSGLAPGFTGLYQFNIVVPSIASGSAVPLTFTLGGTAGTQTLNLAIGN